VNDNLHPFSDLRTVRIEQEFHEQFLPCGKHGKAPRSLMLAASQRRFDILLFWKLDRLSRVRDYARRDDLDYGDPRGAERINISDRTKAGLERARKAGRVPGPKRADIDMDVVRKRQAKGESLRSIAKALGVSPSLLVKRAKAGE